MAERMCHRSGRRLGAALWLGLCAPWLTGSGVATAAVGADIDALIDGTEEHVMGIEGLTVAPSGAWVTRTLSVGELAAADAEPPAGIRIDRADEGGRLWVLGLPAGLDTESLRVSGARTDAESGVRLEREVIRETPRYRRVDTRLQSLEAEARAVDVELEENALRRGIARDQLAALVPGDAGLDALWEEGGPVAGLLGRLSTERVELLDARARLREDVRALRAALEEMRAESPGWLVGVALSGTPGKPGESEPGAAALRLAYRVGNAGWEPVYRARLDTTERQVNWRLTARVHQQTGEDWPAVPTTLATSDQRRFYPVPELAPLTIGFVDPKADRPVRPMAQAPMMLAESAARTAGARVGDETGFVTEIAINKPAPVPSGEGGVNLTVLDQRLDAAMDLRVAPQSSRDAVVVAEFEPNVVHPLPAGRWEVYRDGQQQASQSRSALKPEEPVELSFGVDPRLVVEYDRPPDQRAEHGVIGKFRQIERGREVTVTSRHEQPVPVTVLMRLPTALDADIVVESLTDTTKPAVRGYDGQEGVWAYRRRVEPDEPWRIDFAYRVRWPEDKRISPF